MNTQQNVAELQEKFKIKLDPKLAKRVDEFDRKIIANAYLKLFSGFARVNWTNNYSLGRSWQTALGQCDAFIKTKNNKNPAAKYLRAVWAAHKPYWSQVIMTHKNRDNVIDQISPHAKQIREHGNKMIRDAIDTINMILARYNEYTEELVATAEYDKAQQPATHPQMTQPQYQPNVEYVAEPATKQIAKSGAIPTLRDTKKQSEIPAKVEEKTNNTQIQKINAENKKAALTQAEQRVIANQAQLKIQLQKRMQMWVIGQQFQNAA